MYSGLDDISALQRGHPAVELGVGERDWEGIFQKISSTMSNYDL